jgi:hypothetical protein
MRFEGLSAGSRRALTLALLAAGKSGAMADVFISYAKADRPLKLATMLEAQGWKFWWDTTNPDPERRSRGDPLVARVADYWLFLLPEEDQETTDDGEDERSRLVEKIGFDDVVPSPRPGEPLNDGFQRQQHQAERCVGPHPVDPAARLGP